MDVITVTGFKGGVGKTTTSIHLSAFLGDRGKTVLVDGDSNRSSMEWVKRRVEGKFPFDCLGYKAAGPKLHLYEYVVIDAPANPNSDDLKELAEGCTLLILPTIPDAVSLDPTLQTANLLDEVKASYISLLTMVPPLPNRDGEKAQKALEAAGFPVFKGRIRQTIEFRKAGMQGISIGELKGDRAQKGWKDYASVGEEVLKILG